MQLSDGGKLPAGFSLGMYSSAVRFLSFVGFRPCEIPRDHRLFLRKLLYFCGLLHKEHDMLVFVRHDLLVMKQRNMLVLARHNKLVTARKFEKVYGGTERKTG